MLEDNAQKIHPAPSSGKRFKDRNSKSLETPILEVAMRVLTKGQMLMDVNVVLCLLNPSESAIVEKKIPASF